MKARELKKILNNADYRVANYGEYIAIGNIKFHDIIKIHKATLDMSIRRELLRYDGMTLTNTYAELLFIWHTLRELISSGQIIDIIHGDDEIKNPIPIYTITENNLIETFTDERFEQTIDGFYITNAYFKTKEEAIKNELIMLHDKLWQQQAIKKELYAQINAINEEAKILIDNIYIINKMI